MNPPATNAPISGRSYESLELIGSGTFGTVFSACSNATKKRVALKIIKKTSLEYPKERANALREIEALKSMNHPNVIRILDSKEESSCDGSGGIRIEMELLESDLKCLLDSGTRLLDSDMKRIMLQILLGVAHIHDKRYMHRDLKPANILLDRNLSVKICDFGSARHARYQEFEKAPRAITSTQTVPSYCDEISTSPFDDSFPFKQPWQLPQTVSAPSVSHTSRNLLETQPRELTLGVSTLWYKAPEVLFAERSYTDAIDLWAVGCIFAEIVTGKALFQGESENDQSRLILEGFKLLLSQCDWDFLVSYCKISNTDLRSFLKEQGVSIEYLDLILGFLQFIPSRRTRAQFASHHIIFQDLDST
ncbi:kinase-like domain-containing protein [Obelidium mucronatum]|nr:kinase-like domain-containing protein [Obelidium mucronatum]